jgi:hypothetical protein
MRKMKVFAFLPSVIEPGQVLLARRMELAGFSIFWITHNASDKYWLVKLGVRSERILDTSMPARLEMSQQEVEDRLNRLEAGAQPFVNEIIEMDRRLRHKKPTFALPYLAHIEKVLTKFLEENEIRFVSNGRDTALHLVCHKICQRIGIVSVVPTILRIPDDRFGFCLGYREAEFIHLSDVQSRHIEEADRVVESFRRDKSLSATSVFERRNSRYFRRFASDLALFLKHTYRARHSIGDDVGRYSIPKLFKMYIQKRITAIQLKIAPVEAPICKRPYVLYGLQMQPESSIDVLASYVADQRNLLSVIAKSTPCTHEVYVKPHPEFVGGVSRRELLAIKRIPGVRLISANLNSHDLIMGAAVVMTPTGTMAMESAFFGVPSIIFGEEFFRGLPGVHYCESPSTLGSLIPTLIAAGHKEQLAKVRTFLAYHLANSFAGRVTNYLGPYSEEEISTLITAYSAVYERMEPICVPPEVGNELP